MTLGQKIKDMRKNMGISQEVLGEILNVSRQAITKWETDAGVPDVSNLAELSKLFGVSIDYFLTDKSNDVTSQLDIDITEYKNKKENNMEIIRHFYNEEWNSNFLRYSIYPKNIFVRIILYILNIFAPGFGDALFIGRTLYDVDKINDNYYLLTKENLTFLAYINKNRLIVKNISGAIKIRKGNIINNQLHFAYDNKMFSIFRKAKAEDMSNDKWMATGLLFAFIVGAALIVIFVIFIIVLCFFTLK